VTGRATWETAAGRYALTTGLTVPERDRARGMFIAVSLSPKFRAFFGETPHQFVIRLRLERAADRLRRTDYSVTDVALAVGFESPAHFSRAFKTRFGCSPRAYRHKFGR